MFRFRVLLALLLCLTLPIAGWASVLDGPLCPEMSQHHDGAAHQVHHDAKASRVALHRAVDLDRDCGTHSGHDDGCKGDHCLCGCGMGACTHAGTMLFSTVHLTAIRPGGSQDVPIGAAGFRADPHAALLLRPPIA